MPNPISDPFVELPDVSATPDVVRVESTAEGAVTVWLNRPRRKNAFDGDLISALSEVFETLRGAEHVRVVFLRGMGGAFCTGADLTWMLRDDADAGEDSLALARMLKQAWDLPQLTVALVEGWAFGSGAALAAACDLAVATADVRFGFPEVKNGIIPGMISPYVIEAVGARTARGLFASAREFDAAHAEQIGLITEVVADTAALDLAAARIAEAAMACEPEAVAAAKRLVADLAGRALDAGLVDETAHRTAVVLESPKGREGMSSFMARRKPSWAKGD